MPPKCKFTREEIVRAALDLAREEGIDAITARALGAKLGASPKPIFSVFENMEEVQREVIAAARQLYNGYIDFALNQKDMPAFKGVGMQYIRFALAEPKLFHLLFMSQQPQKPDISNVLPVIDENYGQILGSVRECYGLNERDSERLYRHLWVYSHGIAVLCATNLCSFSLAEIGKLLTEVCVSVLRTIRDGEKRD